MAVSVDRLNRIVIISGMVYRRYSQSDENDGEQALRFI